MEYKILNYNEGIFELNQDFSMPKDTKTEISVRIAPMILYKDDTNIIGMQLALFYRANDQDILKFGYVVSVVVNDWEQLIANGTNPSTIANELREAWDAVINYGRGVLNTKLKDSNYSDLIIPDIPTEYLQKILRIEKIN